MIRYDKTAYKVPFLQFTRFFRVCDSLGEVAFFCGIRGGDCSFDSNVSGDKKTISR